MKKLLVMFAFLSLAFAGYSANTQSVVDAQTDEQRPTVYICLVIFPGHGNEVIATLRDGNFNARVNVESTIDFDYSSESRPTGVMYQILPGNYSSGLVEGPGYTYGGDITVFNSPSDSKYFYVKGSTINW